ncbi:DUF438 domain-containing protein [Pseudoalteromonas denitrificans]|uniref:Hemerythrin-like domain-containing protein n=1 Tax=Pseudoalteromonas denitrificans DSM 6059 TaxID=1123010 RepID=A0A1I1PQD5_9GAMM|nr:PAS domain-containing protein [Pseudoalteromonas denitrificans]SFD09848.1 hypothetical protein SAMN02745724_03479 [Pseudoalteromonas denitrificans DSM 6059]
MSTLPQYAKTLPDGHPVKVYFEENNLIETLLYQIIQIDIAEDYELFFNIFNQLSQVEKHFARKENQLFPYLEKHGWTSPSQGMWAFHDQIRDLFRDIRACIDAKTYTDITRILSNIAFELNRLMTIERDRLFPNALNLLSEDDWKEMREGDLEIGWMLENDPTPYPKETYVHPSQDRRTRQLPFSITDRIRLNEGYMTSEQLNLMLQFMPVDLTYVDENDKVIFYNRGENRVFPRSAGIIGREVKFCHPPKSVDTVLQILEEFKKGTQDTAEFWINFKDRKIHIRYFAIRDQDDNYKGVIEMSQDITEILKIEGQNRLLDWG